MQKGAAVLLKPDLNLVCYSTEGIKKAAVYGIQLLHICTYYIHE